MMRDQNAKLNDLKCMSMSHAEKFCINSKTPPSCAEEHACIGVESFLLMDKEESLLKMMKEYLQNKS